MTKLNYEEFYDYVWDEYIHESVVSNRFLDNNSDLVDNITYDVFHVYKQSQNVSETIFAKIVEQSFKSMITFGIVVNDLKDNLTNNAYDSFNG